MSAFIVARSLPMPSDLLTQASAWAAFARLASFDRVVVRVEDDGLLDSALLAQELHHVVAEGFGHLQVDHAAVEGVRVQRGAEAGEVRHHGGRPAGAREAGLQEVAGDGAVVDYKDPCGHAVFVADRASRVDPVAAKACFAVSSGLSRLRLGEKLSAEPRS
ncbi:MAG: hypothetical protein QM765_01560 [Myxococcales bacterium]